MAFFSIGNDVVNGDLDQAVWKGVSAAGGLYTTAFKGAAYMYQTDYYTTERGRVYHREMMRCLRNGDKEGASRWQELKIKEAKNLRQNR